MQKLSKSLLRGTKSFLLVFLVGVFASLALAQEKAEKTDKTFLWTVKSNSNTVYILGSVHLLKKENYPLNPAIEFAFERANKLVLEVDLNGPGQENLAQSLLKKGMNPDGKTLQESVTPETYQLAEKRAKEIGIEIQAFSRLKPWLVALTISTVKLQSLGFDPNYGVDKYFSDKARKAKKETLGLETVAYQINLFDGMSSSAQEMLLLQTLKDLDVMEKEVTRIIRSWTTGDIETAEKILLESFREYPDVYQRLISDRNRMWLPQIEGLLKGKEDCLVIVGAGHLVGQGGVIELLRGRGYSVEQL